MTKDTAAAGTEAARTEAMAVAEWDIQLGGGQRYPQQDRPDGKKVLERISKETGGELFQVSKKHPIDQIYAEIEEELRNQYNLGYTPDQASTEDTYHLLHLAANQKDLIVQAREGYYSGP